VTRYVALLRAVNVGGTGKLPMADLREMCVQIGFRDVQTYIASGNVVFEADGTAAEVQATLAARLADYAGKPVGVLIRDAAEMAAILAANPFADQPGNKVVTMFLDAPATAADLATARHVQGEEMARGAREIYVHYALGQGPSKLLIPAAAAGTARNMNTVAKLAAMVAAPPA